LLDSFQSWPAESAERRIDSPGLFECGDLIALGLQVALQPAVAGPELRPEAERAVLDCREGHNAHIQRMAVQRIQRGDECRPLLVEREKANLAWETNPEGRKIV